MIGANGAQLPYQGNAGAVPALAASVNRAEVALMKWQTPKLVEIACGCEINAYFPADL
jgi:coenzyme PQQ precursor peptide PqqA